MDKDSDNSMDERGDPFPVYGEVGGGERDTNDTTKTLKIIRVVFV